MEIHEFLYNGLLTALVLVVFGVFLSRVFVVRATRGSKYRNLLLSVLEFTLYGLAFLLILGIWTPAP